MSKIEVNTIEPQCGTTVTVGKCTSTVAVPGNVIKSNAVQASDGGNIVSQSGTDITLGASGDTINLASGASQSGFGRTGTVDWDTTPKTGTVTAATGTGYFVNTTAGGITVNLPAGAAGSIVAVSDYASTAASNKITVTPNGAELINAVNDDYTISTAGLAVTLVYVDATRGWKSVTGSDADATGEAPAYVTATGGTPCAGATCGDYKIHTFTAPGTLCVSCGGNSSGSNEVDYLVVGGGGGGAPQHSGGGGGGGFRVSYCAPAASLPVTATGYPITVGGGGAGGPVPAPGTDGTNGADSIFSTITSAGGGGGGAWPARNGLAGGSGGGGSSGSSPTPVGCGGAGDTPPAPVAQGYAGGNGTIYTAGGGGGGGGSAAVGTVGSAPSAGNGGAGTQNNIDTNNYYWSGGGGGGNHPGTNGGDGGIGGGGGGGSAGCGAGTGGPGGGSAINCGTVGGGATGSGSQGGAGGTNSGGGGGGAGNNLSQGATGGSGIVIIRYKFQ